MADIHDRESHVDSFFYAEGAVHHEFLHQGQTVNRWCAKHLREDIRSKRPQLWRNKSWLLHHDNAAAHALLRIDEFLANTNTAVLAQPPYSPDLALADFFLFPKLKSRISSNA
jgi:hypothetical protein